MTPPSNLAIVIPAYNAAEHLQRSLPATRAIASDLEILVVDAGSTDATAAVATSLGARVLRLPERAGPAEARNRGVDVLEAQVVLFLDSDCVPHPDVAKRVHDAFGADPELVGLCGSYDEHPPDPGFFSQYMNLRHHFTHQHARTDTTTFWAGCGAVRRKAFLEAGGFDEDRFPRPQIEDIELATRLAPLGRMRLDPELRVTHLKRWSLRGVVETDIFSRAVPWSRLIRDRGSMPNDLNLRTSQRVAAALAPLTLLALPGAPLAALLGYAWLGVLGAGVVTAGLALQAPMLRFFARRRGLGFSLGAWLFHQVHLLYSAATFAWIQLFEPRVSRASSGGGRQGGKVGPR